LSKKTIPRWRHIWASDTHLPPAPKPASWLDCHRHWPPSPRWALLPGLNPTSWHGSMKSLQACRAGWRYIIDVFRH
jgi:hypothetical protein